MIMVNDPPATASEPNLFGGKSLTYYGRWTYKYEEAARQGAAGALLIHTTESASYPWTVLQNASAGAQYSLPVEPGQPTLKLKAWVSDAAARRVAAKAGKDLDALRRAASVRGFAAVPLGIRVERHAASGAGPEGITERDRRVGWNQHLAGRALHGPLRPLRHPRAQAGRSGERGPHLQRRGGQCQRRGRHPDYRAGVRAGRDEARAVGLLRSNDARGVGAAGIRVPGEASDAANRSDRGRHQRRQPERPRRDVRPCRAGHGAIHARADARGRS